MIHIVVTVLAVPAHAVKILKGVQVSDQIVYLGIGIKVGRVSLFHLFSVGIQHIPLAGDNTHLNQLGDSEFHPFFLAHVPILVAFGTEIFQSNPDGMIRIFYQIGRPVIENLDAPQLHAHILHVDPAVGNDISQGLEICLIFQIQLINQKSYRYKIPVRQPFCDSGYLFRHIIHAGRQVLNGHGGNKHIRFLCVLLSVLFIGQALHPSVCCLELCDLTAFSDLAAHLFHLCRRSLPELAGTILGIIELLNQRSLDLMLVLFFRRQLLQIILQNAHDGQPLGPLRAPIRSNLPGMTPPELLGITLKKHGIQLASKGIDIKILQRIHRLFHKHCLQITEACRHRSGKSHVPDSPGIHLHRIVEKLLLIINTRHPVPGEHHPVFLLRIGSPLLKRHAASQLFIVIRRLALKRHDLIPPFRNPVIFGKETVSSYIHTVSIIAHCAGNAANLLALLQHKHLVLVRFLQQFICRRHACGTGTDNHCFLHLKLLFFFTI